MSAGPLILGIESSCDETGVGIVRGREVLANVIASSVDEQARYGGVVPEIAARAHLEAMKASSPAEPVLLPVEIQSTHTPAVASTGRASAVCAIEVELNGARLRVRGVPDEAALRCVLQALRALA